MLTPSLMHHLSIVPDFRQAWKIRHQLSDILFLTVCAVICGAMTVKLVGTWNQAASNR